MKPKFKKSVGVTLNKNGATFRVWAPFASGVAITGAFNNWQETALNSEEDGYWSIEIDSVEAGQEYKYVVRNGENTYYRNDPRAEHFTTSAGNSVVAGSEFDWEDDSFTPVPVEQQVIYELHIGTFNRPEPEVTGTFQTAIEKLDYLAELGINTVEIMPIGSMSMDRGWGYAADYIFAVESLYGGRHGLLEFVRAAHKRGIGVVLDVVYNHFGPDEKLDLWQFDGWQQDGKGGIFFYNDWRADTPWGNTRPDYGRFEVQQYILDNVKLWLHDCHIDGLRVDSTIYIRNVRGYNNDPSTDLPEGWYLLQNINNLARKINPKAITIGEDVADNDYITKPTSEGGAGFGAQWELNFAQALRDALWSNKTDEINLTGITSQLTRRFNNDAFQRVIYTDSHDSAANGGARLNEIVAPGASDHLYARKQSLIAAALLMTAPGIPMLFQGQEFMTGGAFNDWEGLDWELTERHVGIIEAYKHLIQLRKNATSISAGLSARDINLMHVDQNNKVIAYHRWNQGGPGDDVVVVINFADHKFNEYVLGFPRNGTWKVRFNSTWQGYAKDFKGVHVPDIVVGNGQGTILLPPNCALILSQDD